MQAFVLCTNCKRSSVTPTISKKGAIMKVSQIAKICKELANLDLPPDCYQTDGDYTQNNCAVMLLAVANLVLQDLYCNWSTAVEKAIVTSENGLINTQNLNMCNVVRLTDGQGNDLPYRYTERGLFVDYDGTFNLLYAKMPQDIAWNDEFNLPSPRMTPRLFAYGMLGEYFHSIGDTIQAERYLSKYNEALRIATRKITSIKMPARRWW